MLDIFSRYPSHVHIVKVRRPYQCDKAVIFCQDVFTSTKRLAIHIQDDGKYVHPARKGVEVSRRQCR